MKHFITWDAFNNYVDNLSQKIRENIDTADYDIVGISRGGLILAAALGYALKIKNVYSVGIRSYSNNDTQDEEIEVYQHLNLGNLRHNLLVVDDVSDTGNTFLYLQKLLIDKETTTVSLAVKDKTKCVSDYNALRLNSDIWVVFPWDK
jgi:hypoxanthine phosphoribosyltransferase